MIKNPIISIVVPVYNVEQYLNRCVDSIICQTYKDLDIILVDDGSTDRSGVICDEYAEKDRRVKVIHQDNAGLSEARNSGIDNARGDYILFVDSDDWIEKDACKKALSISVEQGADVVCFGFMEFFVSGEKIERKPEYTGVIDKSVMMYQLIVNDYNSIVWSKFYSKELFVDLRFSKGRINEDVAIMYKLIHCAKKIFITDFLLYNYAHRENSLSCRRYRPEAIKSRLLNNKERLEFLEQNYPEYVESQLPINTREMIIGVVWLKGEPDYDKITDDYNKYFKQYKDKIKQIKKSNTQIWIYCSNNHLAIIYEMMRKVLYYCRLLCFGFFRRLTN